jgi:DNA repair protein RadC
MTSQKTGRGIGKWPETERPRERLLREGAESLSDAQLLAILLRVGRQEASAVKVGMEVLDRVGGISGLLHCSAEELCTIPGVGPAKAAQLKAAVEVGKRAVSAPLTTGMRISSSADLFKHYHARLRDLRHEIFAVVLLDAKNQVIRDVTISEGSLTLEYRAPEGSVYSRHACVCSRSHFPSQSSQRGPHAKSGRPCVDGQTGVCRFSPGNSGPGSPHRGGRPLCQFCRPGVAERGRREVLNHGDQLRSLSSRQNSIGCVAKGWHHLHVSF